MCNIIARVTEVHQERVLRAAVPRMEWSPDF
jgi:hypothetical protein